MRKRSILKRVRAALTQQGNFIHVAPPKGLFNATDLQLHEEIRIAQAAAKMKNAKAKKGLFA